MFRLGLFVLALSTAALAQQNVPGTFTSASPEHVVPDVLPLVQTPTMTLSNGFEPARVTLPDTMVSERPNMVVGSETLPQGEGMTMSPAATEPSPADFNFAAVDIASAYNFSSQAPSLAAIARRLNKGRVQPHRTYTNDDIQKLNSQAPQSGIMSATFTNGQPIIARNGFNPASGIANMPEAITGGDNGAEVANSRQNEPTNASEAQEQVTAGRETTPTTPLITPQQQGDKRLPASDTNPK